MDSVAEIRRGGLVDALVAEGVYLFYTEPFVKLAASAESGEEGTCDQFSSF